MSMEANWNRMTLQTGWKLQPCFAPLHDQSAEDNKPSHANNATEDSTPAAATSISDSVNPGSPDSDQASSKDALPATNCNNTSDSTDNATPCTSEPPIGND